MNLLPDNARLVRGRVLLGGQDLLAMSGSEIRRFRWRRVSMVFQAAMNAMDPVYRVGDQIVEAIENHGLETRRDAARQRVSRLFELVGLPTRLMDRYPHELSGGMRQRAMIAMALSCEPELVIADEPTTALDVIVQDRILRELKRIQQELGMSMLYITHDIAVVAESPTARGSCTPGSWWSWATRPSFSGGRCTHTPQLCCRPSPASPGKSGRCKTCRVSRPT